MSGTLNSSVTVDQLLDQARRDLATAQDELRFANDDMEQARSEAQRERRSLIGDANFEQLRRQQARKARAVDTASARFDELEAIAIEEEALQRLTSTITPVRSTTMPSTNDHVTNITRTIAEIEETKRALSVKVDGLAAGTATRSEVEHEMRVSEAQVKLLREQLAGIQVDQARDAAARVGQGTEYRMDGTGRIQVNEQSRGGAEQWVRTHDRRPATVARGQRFGDHEIVREHAERMSGRDASIMGQHGSFGQLVRSMSTSSGSALVPTVWASDIIDRARNYAAVLQAGAQIVPMDAKVVQIGRLTADPTASFRTEGSTITASDPVFDNVTLTATTQSALVVGSLEWFQDAENVDEIVSNAIAKAIGLNLDLVAMYGSITSGAGSINLPTPPNPRGILGALNASAATSVLPSSGPATNGTTQTAGSFWNEVLDTIYTPQDYNEKPNAMIWNSKVARKYAKTYNTQGDPLRIPDAVQALETYVSNQIPSYTQGTMTNVASDIFVGDFNQCLIGQRLELNIQTLTERYAELGQVGIVANWRGDVGIARPRAFSVFKAIQGS